MADNTSMRARARSPVSAGRDWGLAVAVAVAVVCEGQIPQSLSSAPSGPKNVKVFPDPGNRSREREEERKRGSGGGREDSEKVTAQHSTAQHNTIHSPV
jgi:hypothetical protein